MLRRDAGRPLAVLVGALLLLVVLVPLSTAGLTRAPSAGERTTLSAALALDDRSYPCLPPYPMPLPGDAEGRTGSEFLFRETEADFCGPRAHALLIFMRDAPITLEWFGWVLVSAAVLTGLALATASGAPAAPRIAAGAGVVVALGALSSVLLLGGLHLLARLRGIPGGEPWAEMSGHTLRFLFVAGVAAIVGGAFGVTGAGPWRGLWQLSVFLFGADVLLPIGRDVARIPDPQRFAPVYRAYDWTLGGPDAEAGAVLLAVAALALCGASACGLHRRPGPGLRLPA